MSAETFAPAPNGPPPESAWPDGAVHYGQCMNSARGGAAEDQGCLISCGCPCHRGWKSRAEYAALVEAARARFRDAYTSELSRARAKGYTEEHDHEHGVQHLLDWATEYLYLGEPIKAAGLIAAARALLACTVHETHGVQS